MVELQVGHQMTAALVLAAGGAAGEEDFFRRATGQIELFERHGRHGRDVLPMSDCLRRFPARETKALIRQIMLELIGKNLQGQGVEVPAGGVVDKVEDRCFHLSIRCLSCFDQLSTNGSIRSWSARCTPWLTLPGLAVRCKWARLRAPTFSRSRGGQHG